MVDVIDNQYAHLVFHTDAKIVHHTFHHALDSANLRLVLNTGVDLLKKHGATKWLSDNREIEAHSEEDTEWINSVWIRNAVEAGWKYWALVVPHDFLAQVNMVDFVNTFYEKGVRIMVFTALDEAMQWLTSIDKS